MGAIEHDFLRLRVILPAAAGLKVHWTELPLLERVVNAAPKAELLFVVRYGKPVFDELNARTDQHPFEFRHRSEELFILVVVAKAHDTLDACPIVPTAVEQDYLTRSRKVRGIALKIPLRPLAAVRCGQRGHPADAGIEPLCDAFDHPTLARGVPALEKHNQLVP